MGVSRGSGPPGNGRPGPVFDTAMRRLVEADPARACRLIGVPVLRVIRTQGGNRTRELMEFAQVLATIRLDTPTIEEIVKEAGMTVESIAGLFRETEFGQLLVNEGRTEGRNEGRTEGRTEGREALLTALLRDRFGDQPGLAAAAHRLAGWPDAAVALHAVTAAADLDDLPAEPPTT
jgi:hypothetical protein